MQDKKKSFVFSTLGFCFLLILISATTIIAQTSFQRKIDVANNDWSHGIVQTPDSGFVIATQNSFFGVGGNIYLSLIKTDKLGAVSWIKGNASLASAQCNELQLTSDSGVAMFGIYSSGSLQYGLLAKADNAGAITFSKRIGGGGKDVFYSGQQTADGGYIMTGSTSSYGQQGLLYSNNTPKLCFGSRVSTVKY